MSNPLFKYTSDPAAQSEKSPYSHPEIPDFSPPEDEDFNQNSEDTQKDTAEPTEPLTSLKDEIKFKPTDTTNIFLSHPENHWDHSPAILHQAMLLCDQFIKATKELLQNDNSRQITKISVPLIPGERIKVCQKPEKLSASFNVIFKDYQPSVVQAADFGHNGVYLIPQGISTEFTKKRQAILPKEIPSTWIPIDKIIEGSTNNQYHLCYSTPQVEELHHKHATLVIAPKTVNEYLLFRLLDIKSFPHRYPLELAVKLFNLSELDIKPHAPTNITGLNDGQAMAVGRFDNFPITILQGPPGTGKTQVIGTICVDSIRNNLKTLITSNNNDAIDAAALKLHQISLHNELMGTCFKKNQVTRYGTPKSTRKMQGLAFKKRKKTKDASEAPTHSFLRNEESEEVVDFYTETIMNDLVSICTTYRFLSGTLPLYDYVMIDEFTMVPGPVAFCVAAICKKKLFLSGDPAQLSFVFDYKGISNVTRASFVHIADHLNLRYKSGETEDKRLITLTEQYRMRDEIAETVRLTGLYHGYTTSSHRKPPEKEVAVVMLHPFPNNGVTIIDTSDFHNPQRNEKSNIAHFTLIKLILTYYLEIPAIKHIGIIAPYSNQAKIIKDFIHDNKINRVYANTVHGFQGAERDLIIWDTVESFDEKNPRYYCDELAFPQLLRLNEHNVAVSRARSKLVVLMNVKFVNEKLNSGCYLQRIHQYAASRNTVIPASICLQNMRINPATVTSTPSSFSQEPITFQLSNWQTQFTKDLNVCVNTLYIKSEGLSIKRSGPLLDWLFKEARRTGFSVIIYLNSKENPKEAKELRNLVENLENFDVKPYSSWPFGSKTIVFDEAMGYEGFHTFLSLQGEPTIVRMFL